LAQTPPVDPQVLALLRTGEAQYGQADYAGALATFQQALDLTRSIANRDGEGASLIDVAIAGAALGQYDQAVDFDNSAAPSAATLTRLTPSASSR